MDITSEAEEKAGALDLIGGELCLDFANTVSDHDSDSSRDYLVSYAALLSWSEHADILPHSVSRRMREKAERRPAEAKRVLERATALREALFRIFMATSADRTPQPQDLALLNEHLAHALSHSQILSFRSAFEWGWQSPEDALDQMLWPIARSAADLLTSDRLSRVRECEGDLCGWLFVDLSKNHSRRWCSMGDCGNRAKAQRFYSRHNRR
jgi:predicted RNA-binding Zn ribbon-like protein